MCQRGRFRPVGYPPRFWRRNAGTASAVPGYATVGRTRISGPDGRRSHLGTSHSGISDPVPRRPLVHQMDRETVKDITWRTGPREFRACPGNGTGGLRRCSRITSTHNIQLSIVHGGSITSLLPQLYPKQDTPVEIHTDCSPGRSQARLVFLPAVCVVKSFLSGRRSAAFQQMLSVRPGAGWAGKQSASSGAAWAVLYYLSYSFRLVIILSFGFCNKVYLNTGLKIP